MTTETSVAKLRFASALSGHLDAVQAAEHCASRCAETLAGARPDLITMFFSAHHVHATLAMVKAVRDRLPGGALIGCSAEMVLGGEMELEGVPGVAMMAGSMPGSRVHTFTTASLPHIKPDVQADYDALAAAAGFGPDHRGTLLFADPFSLASNTLMPALSQARNKVANPRSSDRKPGPIIGGFASSAGQPGGNVLVINDQLYNAGGVGVSISGPVRIDALVSQGCKPIGEPMVVTGGKGQMISQLGGRPALKVLSEFLDELKRRGEEQKLRRGLFIGRAIDEYKSRFGRDDFLIRNVIGVDKANEAVAVADLIRIGQTIQFHIRDAETADEDLGLLLDAQQLHDAPAGILLCTCNGRGTRLFTKPNHDAGAFSRAFAPQVEGAEQAKGGSPIPERKATVPLAGFFCAGEIGPIGNEVFVHGQTASAAIFREADGVV